MSVVNRHTRQWTAGFTLNSELGHVVAIRIRIDIGFPASIGLWVRGAVGFLRLDCLTKRCVWLNIFKRQSNVTSKYKAVAVPTMGIGSIGLVVGVIILRSNQQLLDCCSTNLGDVPIVARFSILTTDGRFTTSIETQITTIRTI